MLRIYGAAKSRTLRVLWMVGELGIPYEQKDWLPRSPETRTPEYRVLNPNARVPTIDDEGFVLSARRHGESGSRQAWRFWVATGASLRLIGGPWCWPQWPNIATE